MAWIIGIDEAGYGPNLGPFVMTSVACRVHEDLVGGNLWRLLKKAVRRHKEPDDGRLLVDDSKLVYTSDRGLIDLETSVLAALSPDQAAADPSLAQYVAWLSPTASADLAGEPWYTGNSGLPVEVQAEACQASAKRFAETCQEKQVAWGLVRSVVVCTQRFNQLLDREGSKGAVLAHALKELLQCNRSLDEGAEPVHVFVDKHGGRNTYAAMLQDALHDGFVVAQEEGAARSVYGVLGLERPLRLTFQPRADAEHFCVALASMVSKYLREVLMLEFNRFWQEQLPGLKPTAGYPGDAARFFDEIRPAIKRLGIAEGMLWRRK